MVSLWTKKLSFKMLSNNSSFKAIQTSNSKWWWITSHPWIASSSQLTTPSRKRWVPCSSSYRTDSKTTNNQCYLNNSNRTWLCLWRILLLWILEKSSIFWWLLPRSWRFVQPFRLLGGGSPRLRERVLSSRSFICTWTTIFLGAYPLTRPWTRDIGSSIGFSRVPTR